ncbi:MAG: hypothetical protein P8180_02995 [Gammaproteobacteria bacterium]|jgi:hypothetical protein
MPSTSNMSTETVPAQPVLAWQDIDCGPVKALLARYGLSVIELAADAAMPGSFWGAPETGLIGACLYVRPDTPVHSVLHEACHYVCMDAPRRERLHTDAGGDYDEENAVCYLQILLAGTLKQVGSARIARDMDRWGYSFRLGSAQAWFAHDADDARRWLEDHGLIRQGAPTWAVRA